ncbi:hypothetical protein KCP75_10085 [Salmonella enterica subsp. enterica]|nr:hypothetical protein KCP75_10085 [Salmonella enterica subsp. enterica]
MEFHPIHASIYHPPHSGGSLSHRRKPSNYALRGFTTFSINEHSPSCTFIRRKIRCTTRCPHPAVHIFLNVELLLHIRFILFGLDGQPEILPGLHR